MTIAALLDFEVHENEDFTSPEITIKDPGGTPRDLTGVDLRMQVRAQKSGAGSPLLDLAIGAGITVVDAVGGIIQIAIERFAVRPAGEYVQDLVEDDSGICTLLWEGKFTVRGGVTRY